MDREKCCYGDRHTAPLAVSKVNLPTFFSVKENLKEDFFMDNCKYNKNEVVDGIKHEICSNGELKELNKSNGKNIPCIGRKCGKFEENDNNQEEAKE